MGWVGRVELLECIQVCPASSDEGGWIVFEVDCMHTSHVAWALILYGERVSAGVFTVLSSNGVL